MTMRKKKGIMIIFRYRRACKTRVFDSGNIVWNYKAGIFGAKQDEIDFKVYSWATDPFGSIRYLRKNITSNHFMNNYNGYIKVK